MSLSHETLKKIIIASLVVYACMGLFERSVRDGSEIYPFFSWFLFAYIPNPSEDTFTVAFHAVGDEVYDPALTFSESRPLFDKIHQSPTEYIYAIQEFGRSVSTGRTDLAEQYRASFERMFSGQAARYELFLVSYDPVRDWREGKYASSTSLGIFETHR
ncbi:MAG: hypothetical protein Athens041674_189 [Parcubacteria group bacterium Athens0416_74]|nr:MAG: hypothetical protein Athens041674_189 [Parcubacteria group bacterium Athens0416_74]